MMSTPIRYVLATFCFTLFYCRAYTQVISRPLYRLTITKTVNDENARIDKYVEVDSSGQIYEGGNKKGKIVELKKFSKKITKYISQERLYKNPGNDDIILLEFPMPKLNEQHVVVSVIFLDDFYQEKNFRNKTYYSWGIFLNKEVNDYPLFKYLNETELKLIKALLK